MTTTRFLTGVLLVALGAAGPAAAQTQMPPYSAPGRSPGLAPSVLPPGADDPGLPPRPPRPPGTARSLERMTTPAAPGEEADPYGALTGLPNPAAPPGPAAPPPLPPGT